MLNSLSFAAFTTILSAHAFAGVTYTCQPSGDNSNTETQKVFIASPSKVVLNGQDKALIDAAYKPRGGNVNYVRLAGTFKSLNDGVDGYTVNVLVSKTMMNGEEKGSIKVFSSGEDFFNDYFFCKKD